MSAIFGTPALVARSLVTAVPPPIQPLTRLDEGTAPPADSLRPSFGAPTAPASTTTVPSTARSTPAAAPDATPPSPQPQPAASANVQEDPNWRRLQTIFARHQSENPDATGDAPSDPIQRQAESDSPPVPPTLTESTAPASDISPPPDEPASARRTRPLEAAWPVQRTDTDESGSGRQPFQNIRLHSPTPPVSAEAAQKVGSQLRQVAPGQATDSPIELIMPTRPRPQQKQGQTESSLPPNAPIPDDPDVSAAAVDVPKKPLPIESTARIGPLAVPTPVERSADPAAIPHQAVPATTEAAPTAGSQPDEITPAPVFDSPIESNMPTRPRLQRQADNAAAAELPPPIAQTTAPLSERTAVPPAEPDMIPTDIGPLPADLWERLGEALPPQTAEPTNPVAAKRVDNKRQTAVTPSIAVHPPADAPIFPAQTAPPQSGEPPTLPQTIGSAVALAAAAPVIAVMRQTEPYSDTPDQSFPPETTAVPTHSDSDSASQLNIKSESPQAVTAEHRQPTRSASIPISTLPASQSVQRATAASETAGEQATIQQAIAQAESVSSQSVQRLPQLPSLETAAAALPTFDLPEMPRDLETMLGTEQKSEDNAPDPAADFDMDELSRRVYQALKRKLTVEWERGYGR